MAKKGKKKTHTCVHGTDFGRYSRKWGYEVECPDCKADWAEERNRAWEAKRDEMIASGATWCETCTCWSWPNKLCQCATWEKMRQEFYANPRHHYYENCSACQGRGSLDVVVRKATWFTDEKRKRVDCVPLPPPTCSTCGVLYGTCVHTTRRADPRSEESWQSRERRQDLEQAQRQHDDLLAAINASASSDSTPTIRQDPLDYLRGREH
jgi:hypothetical protein